MIEEVYDSLAGLWAHVWRHCDEEMSICMCIYANTPLENTLSPEAYEGSGIHELTVSMRVT